MTTFWTLHAPAMLALVVPVVMMPGLDFAAVARNALAGGRPAGLAAAAGNTLGASLYIFAAAVGTGTLVDGLPGADKVLRLLGACVLFWFAWRFLSLARTSAGALVQAGPASRRGAFGDGALAAVLNPKTPLFFAAVFSAGGIAGAATAERIGVALLVCGIHFAWFAGVAFGLGRLRGVPRSAPWLRAGAAAIAVLLATAGFLALIG